MGQERFEGDFSRNISEIWKREGGGLARTWETLRRQNLEAECLDGA